MGVQIDDGPMSSPTVSFSATHALTLCTNIRGNLSLGPCTCALVGLKLSNSDSDTEQPKGDEMGQDNDLDYSSTLVQGAELVHLGTLSF